MSVQIGVVMDPIESISFKKDSTLAMLLAAQRRGWTLQYMRMEDLFVRDGESRAHMRSLRVANDPERWFELDAPRTRALGELDVVLMRKDPPFDMEYVYATYILERAEASGTLVVNKAQSLRDANEKMYTAWFAPCCPPTLVTRSQILLHDFIAEHEDIIVKPLDGMGGTSIFRVKAGEPNTNVIFETLTDNGERFAMAQRYIPDIVHGDKRVLLIEGEPMPYGLARVPADDDARGNLAAGARGVPFEIGERERRIARQVGPVAREKGLLFVGLDVIGDYLTEVNVTSPTCIREIEAACDIDIAGQLMDAIASRVAERLE